ncbi:MAG: DNA polymerase III subunit alpha [Coriobacteriia bacterium]
MPGFVHLHVHSRFSFMDGAADLDALVERAASLGMPALALTDHQGLYGAIRFYKKALAAGIKPIIGCEVAVSALGIPGEERDIPPDERIGLPPDTGFGRARGRGWHLTLLAKDREGYSNLCRILSRAHLRSGDSPSVVTPEDLSAHSRGLIALTGCPEGEVGRAILAGERFRARVALRRLVECFSPGDVYVEVMNLLTPDSPRYVSSLVDLADSEGLPVVATNDVHYVRPEGFRAHDVLAAAGARQTLPGPLARTNGELWLKPAGEMRALFRGLERACDATLEVAERCDMRLDLEAFHFPAAKVPASETPYSLLSKLAWAGVETRYRPLTPEVLRRLQHELAVIDDLGFSEYFLVVKEIVDFARSRGIRHSGRGSAGDSIVTYALGITDADPIAHGLLFERFLNPMRRQMPDIDIDFDSARRDEVVDFIYERFGEGHVATVATVNHVTARSAVRIVARAFGYGIDQVNTLSRGLPWVPAGRIREALAAYPECQGHPLQDESEHGLLLDLVEELDGCPMHLGTHLGGLLITREPLTHWTPLQWAAKGVVVSQFDKDDVEALGLVKMDILGLRMHSAISEAVRLARERVGEQAVPEPWDLTPDDPAVYRMIADADTVGVFQLESSGQRNLAKRLRQSDFQDVIAAISLFRPGPMEAEMITPYIRRRHGREPVTVPHPAMMDVLEDTYGVIVYQEQVLQVAQAVAGFDLAEADSLRRMMTRDRSREEMEAIRERFLERSRQRGLPDAVAREVFRQLEGFAAYGFNKAHAACFAVVSYASAWLKRYFPAEFACAILNHEPMGFYSARTVLDDARRHGIEVLPVHVNASCGPCTVEEDGKAIRVGLSYVMHVPHDLPGRVVREREHRPFDDLADFLRRTRADIASAQALIEVGALDGLGVTTEGRPPTRDEMLALLPELKAVIAKEGVAGDDTLAIAPAPVRDRRLVFDHVSGWSLAERLSKELELTGLAITCHPLELARQDLERKGMTWAKDLPGIPDGERVVVAGLRERAQTPRTRSGNRTCFLTLEDPTGLSDVVVFQDVLERVGATIVRERAYVVEGVLQNNEERGLAIVCEDVKPYRIRTAGGRPVRLRRGVGQGALGPTRGGAGAPEQDGHSDSAASISPTESASS